MSKSSLARSDEHDGLAEVSQRFAVAITPAMADLIDPQDPTDPIALQFAPDTRELLEHPADHTDPIGDNPHSPLPGIVHRYPDRLLLTPIRVCPVYCRFCFRRETVGKPEHALLSDSEMERALDYIRDHAEIWEVILSGGDPLLLSPRRLKRIVTALDAIDHVAVIRIHTRVPVVAPDRISASLVSSLDAEKAVYVVLHSNHPRELTASARRACDRLIDAGIPMLSQTVLLKGVNDDPETLGKLFRQLVANRVKPYYLHHADRAPGTAHFHTSVKKGREIMQGLRGKISGLCQPSYVLDIPGGAGKVPLERSWAETDDGRNYRMMDYQGRFHLYHDHCADGDHPLR